MNPFRSNVGTLNEILFENKNKQYGAYAIRTAYENTVLKSLGLTSLIFLAGFRILSLLFSQEAEVIVPPTDDPKLKITPYEITPPKIDPPPASDDHRNTNPEQRNNNLPPMITETATDSVPNNSNIEPPIVNNPTPGTGTTSVETGTTAGTNTFAENNNEPTKFPDVFPEFPGLKKFWAANIRYPSEARELNVEGKVAINFIVDENGKIISLKIIKKLGYGCDEEVLRVAGLMPNWRPGKIGDKPVKVSFNQVIDFKLK